MMPGQQQQKSFAESDEAQEYIQKLQAEKVKLPDDASPLEHEAFNNLTGLGKRMRDLNTAQSDMDKEIAALQQRREAMKRDVDVITGQMGAFASILVSAEGARRKPAKVDEMPEEAKPQTPPEQKAKEDAKPTPINKGKAKDAPQATA
jgi:hypothetical protein